MTDKSRRKFNKLVASSITLVPLSALVASRTATAAAVDPESAPAKALSFVLESEKEDQTCVGCLFYSKMDDENGKCIVFANGEVPAGGWCSSFQAKK